MSAVFEDGKDISFRCLSEAIGAEVLGIDIRAPLDDGVKSRLRSALSEYRLLLIRDEKISAVNQADFAKIFGDIVIRQNYDVERSAVTDTQFVSKTREDGILGDGELDFHHDQLFQEEPLKALILYGIEVPAEGGETSFVHTTRAYEAMPETLRRRLDGKSCLHLYDFKGDYTGFQEVETASPGSPRANHPILYREPGTGAIGVWVNRLTTIRVNELPMDESQVLIDEVRGYFRDERIIYRHKWRKGDLLIWDNRILQHARGPFDKSLPRTLRRTPIV